MDEGRDLDAKLVEATDVATNLVDGGSRVGVSGDGDGEGLAPDVERAGQAELPVLVLEESPHIERAFKRLELVDDVVVDAQTDEALGLDVSHLPVFVFLEGGELGRGRRSSASGSGARGSGTGTGKRKSARESRAARGSDLGAGGSAGRGLRSVRDEVVDDVPNTGRHEVRLHRDRPAGIVVAGEERDVLLDA